MDYFYKQNTAYSLDVLSTVLTLWRPVVPHGYSYKASHARPG